MNNYAYSVEVVSGWFECFQGAVDGGNWEMMSRTALIDLVFGPVQVHYEGSQKLMDLSLEMGAPILVSNKEDVIWPKLGSTVNRRGIPFWNQVVDNIFSEEDLRKLKDQCFDLVPHVATNNGCFFTPLLAAICTVNANYLRVFCME